MVYRFREMTSFPERDKKKCADEPFVSAFSVKK